MTAALALVALLFGLVVLAGCEPAESAPTDDGAGVELEANTVILTVGDSAVYWPEFFYWLRFITDYYKEQNGLETIADWGAQVNGRPLEDFFLSSAVDYVGRHRALEAKAAEMGIALSEADLQQMAADRAQNVSIYGSESEYLRIIRRTYVSEDVFDYLVKIGYLSDDVFADLYGPAGEKCADSDVSTYVAEKGLLCARYIFRPHEGQGSAASSEQQEAENRALLEDCIEQLEASADPETLFSELVLQHNQDPEALGYTDGVLFLAAQMPEEFMAAYDQLGAGEWSGIVRSDEGLYLIMKAPIKPDMVADQAGNTLRYRTAYDSLFQKQVNAWYAALEIEFTAAYGGIDLEDLFGPGKGATSTTAAR